MNPQFRAALSRSCVALGLALLAACAGSGEGLDANGNPIGSGGDMSSPLSADFESIQENIFTPICSVCHAGGSAPEGLRLDAANSYIIQKLQGHAAVGAQMPDGCPTSQPCLTDTQIGFIQQWITNGAPPAATAAAAAAQSAPLAVTSIVPETMESVNAPPPQVMVAFNHELDVSQLATHSAHFEKLAPGAAPVVMDQVPARISVSSANLRALMIWPARTLSAGHYRLVIDATSSSRFSDIAGEPVAPGTPDERGQAVISTFEVEVNP